MSSLDVIEEKKSPLDVIEKKEFNLKKKFNKHLLE